MKYLIQISFFFFLVTQICFAQNNFWKQTNGPPGGEYHRNASAMNLSGEIFAGDCYLGYVYKSTDHGLSWIELTNGLDRAHYSSIAVNRKGYIFAGCWSHHGLYRSTDNGESWFKTTFPYGYSGQMVIDSIGNLLVSTFHDCAGIIRTTDDGETWTPIGPVTGIEMNGIAINAKGYIFAGADTILYRSTDNGSSWIPITLNFRAQHIAFDSLDHVYVIRGYSYGFPSLYYSTDDGENWDAINTLPPVPEGATYNSIEIDSDGNFFVGSETAYATEEWAGAYRSTDGCNTWTQIYDLCCRGFMFNEYGHTLMFTINTGISYSTDKGENWQLTGPAASRVQSLALSPSGNILAGTDFFSNPATGGLYFSSNDGNSWIFGGLHDKSVKCLVATDLDKLLVGTQNGIYMSTDYGTNWSLSGLLNNSITCLENTISNKVFAGTESSGLYRSADSGTSWSFVGFLNNSIYSLWVDASDTLYVGLVNEGIYRSADGGTSWSFLGLPNTTITSLSITGYRIYAGTNSGVYKSQDNGMSWSYIGLNNRYIQDIVISLNDVIFAATSDSGVYRSDNEGLSWTVLSSGMNYLNVTSLLIDMDDYLYAATEFGGVYKSIDNILAVDEENRIFPSSYLLYQNFPNPFNPNTKITYSIPQSSNVIIKVFDILGNEIETLVNEEKPIGTYEITWYAGNLPSGVYFYQFQAGDYVESKKMVLIK